MLNAIQMGIINQSTKQRLDELEDRKADIELQIIQEEIKKPMLSREDVTFWICRFRKLDVSKLEERRRLIDSFVNSVTIFDDYILITFNYKEGEERLIIMITPLFGHPVEGVLLCGTHMSTKGNV